MNANANAPYQPDMVPTPLSLLNNDDDEPNIPLDDRPCAKLLTALKYKHTRYSRQRNALNVTLQ